MKGNKNLEDFSELQLSHSIGFILSCKCKCDYFDYVFKGVCLFVCLFV